MHRGLQVCASRPQPMTLSQPDLHVGPGQVVNLQQLVMTQVGRVGELPRAGTEVQFCRGAEAQRCGGAEVCRGAQACRKSAKVHEVGEGGAYPKRGELWHELDLVKWCIAR